MPCGKCPECLKRRISGWSFRLMQEDKHASSSYFLTLTYDTAKVHITQNGFMGLNKRDVQLFFKRLRKAHNVKEDNLAERSTIKYYAVGEYGGRTMRPHYHIILFNAKLELVQPAWDMGSIHYGEVSGASVGYTLKYMSKASKIPMHRNDDRLREFSLMSKGLGEKYLTNVMVRWHHLDLKDRMFLTIEDGKKIAMPRYYKNKIYVESERKYINWHCERLRQQKLQKQEKLGIIPTERDRAESVKSAFKKMHRNAEDGRNTV